MPALLIILHKPGAKEFGFIRQMGPYDHYANGLPRNSKLGLLKQKFLLLDKWILEKREMYKFGKQSSSFDPTSQTEDIGNSSKSK
jgi:hypothetical protein